MLGYASLLLVYLWAGSFARDLPLSYMNEGDVCRRIGTDKWTCRTVETCPNGVTDFGKFRPCGHDQVIPLTCCPPHRHRPQRQLITPARHYCEKYTAEKCSGSFNKPLWDVDPRQGGKLAAGKQLPHMALIGYGRQKTWACGGSLISHRYVLSAAHCVYQFTLGPARWVRLGEVDYLRTDDDARPEDLEIVERTTHPEYRHPAIYHDLALFKLEREVKFSPWISPICLHTDPDVRFKFAMAAGWDRQTHADRLSSAISVVGIDMAEKSSCNKMLKASHRKLDGGLDAMLCFGDMASTKDACRRHSGGSLQAVEYWSRCMPTLIGVSSYGTICPTRKSAGIYTKVESYVPWIEGIVWGNTTYHETSQ